jgi:hypothetical protein
MKNVLRALLAAAAIALASGAAPQATLTVTVQPSPAPSSGSYVYDGCTWTYPDNSDGTSYGGLTVDHYGAPASSDSAAIIASEASDSNGGMVVGNTHYMNDVQAGNATYPMTANNDDPFPPNWMWPVPVYPPGPTIEHYSDAGMQITEHLSNGRCNSWESDSTTHNSNYTAYTAWTAGEYPDQPAAGYSTAGLITVGGVDPKGPGPTSVSNMLTSLKYEDVTGNCATVALAQSNHCGHTLQLLLLPSNPRGHSYVYPAAQAENINSSTVGMAYGMIAMLKPSASCLSASGSSGVLAWILEHYGMMLLNTNGSSNNSVTLLATNADGVRDPSTSSFPSISCSFPSDFYILQHGALQTS